jgi:hypothetical protein
VGDDGRDRGQLVTGPPAEATAELKLVPEQLYETARSFFG